VKLVNRILRVGRNADIRNELTEGTATLEGMNQDAKSLIERIKQEADKEERRVRAAHR
jgi:hypothetical protein